jgi:hypothetical protein
VSDPGFVAGAYSVVLGGLAVYVATIARRARAARRAAEALDRERRTDLSIPSPARMAEPTDQSSEAPP